MSDFRSISRAAALGFAALSTGFAVQAASLTENFDVVVPTGWTVVNNSSTPGTTSWFQGNTAVFTSHAGATNSYAGANFNAVGDDPLNVDNISTWLISPTLSFDNGDLISFFSRTVAAPAFADRLELRFSNVGGVNVGITDSSVGTFTSLLLTINPTLTTSGYPSTWTNYTATITGLSGPTSGAIAFRYFVLDGGPSGNNSDYIGVDTLTITAVPEPATYLLMALGLGAFVLRRNRA